MHNVGNCGCCDRLDRNADDCCVLHSADVDVVNRRDVGRKYGVAAAETMRRRRIALDGAIVAV